MLLCDNRWILVTRKKKGEIPSKGKGIGIFHNATLSYMDSFALVIFGATGNLAQIKLFPALYDLEAKGLLPGKTKIFGIARQPHTIGAFRDWVDGIIKAG